MAKPISQTRAVPWTLSLPQKPTCIKVAEDIDLYDVFRCMEQQFDTCFLLEALGEHSQNVRYAIAGFAPDHLITARGSNLIIDGKAYEVPNPYKALREIMPPPTVARGYAGGFTGYLGYDAINYFEPSLSVQTHPDFDPFMFGVYTDWLALDTHTGELFYFFYKKYRSNVVHDLLSRVATVPLKPLKVRSLGDTLTKNAHAKAVKEVHEHIKAGNVFQCEVGFKTKFVVGEALPIYGRLREINPSPHMYYMKFGDKKLFGASPELLMELHQGMLSTKPMAGSIPRGKTLQEDRKLARQLLNDPKEIAEHNMLVDLHRNDIGRVAEFGSVRVRDLRSIKRFSHIQHIESEITGRLRHEEDMFSALASHFPAGTLSGAPKIESIKIIDAQEPDARGPYGGAVGSFGFNGDCSFAIAIRSLFVAGDQAYAQACSGIVFDSKIESEYNEIRHKLAAMERALGV
jgi:anthranilate synthase component I